MRSPLDESSFVNFLFVGNNICLPHMCTYPLWKPAAPRLTSIVLFVIKPLAKK